MLLLIGAIAKEIDVAMACYSLVRTCLSVYSIRLLYFTTFLGALKSIVKYHGVLLYIFVEYSSPKFNT